MSSAIATLLIGLGTFLVSRLEPGNMVFFVNLGVLLVGILLAALAIAFFINAYKVRPFYFPFVDDKFFTIEKVRQSILKKFFNRFKKAKENYVKIEVKQDGIDIIWPKSTCKFDRIATTT
jgi:hypothetical protein